ncbi:MAG: hypothetical protein ACE5HI_13295 [bacterium]
MFRKYNKKIITAILVVIVGIGLIGPGALLIFTTIFQTEQSAPPTHGLQVVTPETSIEAEVASSSTDIDHN